jgi:hypothetical protein
VEFEEATRRAIDHPRHVDHSIQIDCEKKLGGMGRENACISSLQSVQREKER